ncbi:peptide chain release factor-like protein [Kiritimatiellaeota bacterium B1221]|nr:peptide chain release factor-like protein [Kiritimatiellaeota bacterium B1221]
MQASESPWERVQHRMQQLGLAEADLDESFVLAGGSGGQKVNKTASAVQLIHVPSGTMVKCAEGRSQHMNRLKARERLCEKMEAQRRQQKLERDARRAKMRHQKRKPSARQQAKRIGNKRVRGEVKKLRGRPSRDD